MVILHPVPMVAIPLCHGNRIGAHQGLIESGPLAFRRRYVDEHLRWLIKPNLRRAFGPLWSAHDPLPEPVPSTTLGVWVSHSIQAPDTSPDPEGPASRFLARFQIERDGPGFLEPDRRRRQRLADRQRMIPIVHDPAAIFIAHSKRRGVQRRRFAAQSRINAMEKAHQLRIQIEIVRTHDIDDR